MDVQKEREAFEAWFKEKHKLKNETKSFDLSGGEYYFPVTQSSWEGWQAAKAQAVPDGFVLINKESLAFHARSIRMFNSGEHYKEEVEEHVCSIEAMIEAQEPSYD